MPMYYASICIQYWMSTMHNAQRHKLTDRQTDRQTDDIIMTTLLRAVRSAKTVAYNFHFVSK